MQNVNTPDQLKQPLVSSETLELNCWPSALSPKYDSRIPKHLLKALRRSLSERILNFQPRPHREASMLCCYHSRGLGTRLGPRAFELLLEAVGQGQCISHKCLLMPIVSLSTFAESIYSPIYSTICISFAGIGPTKPSSFQSCLGLF